MDQKKKDELKEIAWKEWLKLSEEERAKTNINGIYAKLLRKAEKGKE